MKMQGCSIKIAIFSKTTAYRRCLCMECECTVTRGRGGKIQKIPGIMHIFGAPCKIENLYISSILHSVIHH